jgi:hypothetical protein
MSSANTKLTVENIDRHKKQMQDLDNSNANANSQSFYPLKGNDRSMFGQLYVGDVRHMLASNSKNKKYEEPK